MIRSFLVLAVLGLSGASPAMAAPAMAAPGRVKGVMPTKTPRRPPVGMGMPLFMPGSNRRLRDMTSTQLQVTAVLPLLVSPVAYSRGWIEVPGAVQLRFASPTHCTIQVSAQSDAMGIRLNGANGSDLEIRADNRAQNGQVAAPFGSFAPLSPQTQTLWSNALSGDSPDAPALDIGVRINSLSSYPSGQYSASLLFTVLPQ